MVGLSGRDQVSTTSPRNREEQDSGADGSGLGVQPTGVSL